MADCCFSQCQGPVQATIRPAYWIPGLRTLHAAKESWDLGGTPEENLDKLVQAVEKFEKEQRWCVRKVNKRRHFIRIFSYTKSQWLDVTEIRLVKRDQGTLAKAVSFSSGILPVCVPLAPLFNIIFCWVPFLDHGMNQKRLDILREAVNGSIAVFD